MSQLASVPNDEETETTTTVTVEAPLITAPWTRYILSPLVRTLQLTKAPSSALVVAQVACAVTAAVLALRGAPGVAVGLFLFATALPDKVLARAQAVSPFWPALRAITDTLVIVAIAVAAYGMSTGPHLVGAGLAAFAGIYCTSALVAAARKDPGFNANHLRQLMTEPGRRWGRWAVSFTNFVDRLTGVACAAVALAVGRFELVSAIAVATSAAWFTIAGQAVRESNRGSKVLRLAAAYFVGSMLLVYLVSRMPLSSLTDALNAIGLNALWALLPGPLLALCSALSVYTLCGRRVPWSRVFYVQFVSDGYNQVLPLAGLGGEPYKIRVLSEFIPAEEAGQIVLLDRMLHGIPGPLIGGAWLLLSVSWLALSTALESSLFVAGVLLIGLALILLTVTFSRIPGRVTQLIARKFTGQAVSAPPVNQAVPYRRLWLAFFFKLLGQAVVLFEVWLLYRLLSIEPSIAELALIAGAVTVSAILFFVIPQQLGVNEAGITAAFDLLSLPLPLAIVFGLLRRARQVTWALVGIFMHMIFHLVTGRSSANSLTRHGGNE